MFISSRSAALSCVVCLTACAQEWTEQRVVQQFLSWHPLQRETRARVAVANAETRSRTLYANPIVSFSHEGAGRTEFYQAAQTLPLSGRFPLLRDAGAWQIRSLEAEGDFALWQARSALRAAFHRVVALQRQQLVIAEGRAELDQLTQLLKDREREGEGSALDRLRAEREQALLAADAGSLRARLSLARGEVLEFLPPATELGGALTGTLESLAALPAAADLVRRALAARPDLEAERRRVQQFALEQRAAQRLRFPEPAITGGLKRSASGLVNVASGPVVGISLALPVFNQGKAEVSRYAAEQERASARLQLQERRLGAAVEAAWHALDARRATLREFAALSNDDLTRISWIAYQEGEIGIIQLLDAHRLRREAKLRQVELASAAKEAQIALEALVGEELQP